MTAVSIAARGTWSGVTGPSAALVFDGVALVLLLPVPVLLLPVAEVVEVVLPLPLPLPPLLTVTPEDGVLLPEELLLVLPLPPVGTVVTPPVEVPVPVLELDPESYASAGTLTRSHADADELLCTTRGAAFCVMPLPSRMPIVVATPAGRLTLPVRRGSNGENKCQVRWVWFSMIVDHASTHFQV